MDMLFCTDCGEMRSYNQYPCKCAGCGKYSFPNIIIENQKINHKKGIYVTQSQYKNMSKKARLLVVKLVAKLGRVEHILEMINELSR